MPPRKRSKSRPKKTKAKARRAKPARGKKAARKKPTPKGSRRSVPVVFRRQGGKSAAAQTVDTLGEWQHEHHVEPDTGEFTEDDIPPDYGGSE